MTTRRRHSYVPFYISDWMGGTARMTRIQRSVYFDICCHNWDKAEPCPDAEMALMLGDLPDWQAIVDILCRSGRIEKNDVGYYSPRALAEAEKALGLWEKKSSGGRKAAVKLNSSGKTPDGSAAKSPVIEQDQEPEPEPENTLEGIQQSPKTYDLDGLLQGWNKVAKVVGLPTVVKLTEERRKKARARIDEYGQDTVMQAIGLIPGQRFLLGDNDRGWKANIDFFLRPDTIAKIMEGNYGKQSRAGAWDHI